MTQRRPVPLGKKAAAAEEDRAATKKAGAAS